VFNRQQQYVIAQSRENARGAGIAAGAKRDEVAFRTASLYLDAERAARVLEIAQKQTGNLDKVDQTMRVLVEQGRELPINAQRTAVDLARSRQRGQILENDLEFAETSLAIVLGLEEGDRARPAVEQSRLTLEPPASEDAAVKTALESNKEIRRMESALIAEGLDIRAQKAARLPRVDLVAQYGLFARFNNYEDFFRTFHRNNGLIGMSFQIPVLVGPAVGALSAEAEINASRLRIQLTSTRQRISSDTRRSFQDIKQAETAGQVAKMDLDLARGQVSVLLARMSEGRTSMREVEQARFAENEKWIAFYDAQFALEKAKLAMLRQTGELIAVLSSPDR